MTSSWMTATKDIGYPLFGARFVNDDRIVVCGGGGEGKNGIKNKISVLSIDEDDEEPLSIDREIELPDDEDNPTSLDVYDGTIYVGVNRSDEKIEAKQNDHLRLFQLKDGKFNGSVDEYQKVTTACSTLVAICSSLSPGTLYVLSTRNMKQPKYTKTVENGEINDIQFSPDEKYLALCTNRKITVLESGSGRHVEEIEIPWNDRTFSKIRFTDSSTLVAGVVFAGRKGTLIAKYNIPSGELVAQARVNKVKALTAMDAGSKYIAVSSADLSLAIVSAETLKTLHVFTNVHPFAITSVTLNESEDRVASTSVANTIHVSELPKDGEFHRDRQTFVWAVSSIVLTILIAVMFQLLIKYQIIDSLVVHEKLWNKWDSMKINPPLGWQTKQDASTQTFEQDEEVDDDEPEPEPVSKQSDDDDNDNDDEPVTAAKLL